MTAAVEPSDADELPSYEDLSTEQDDVFNLPLDGNYLVSGPPGTGKSVMALYRAEALTIDDRDPAILMFNNVLKQYTQRHAARLGIEKNVETFHRWMYGFWRRTYGGKPPMATNDAWAYDWAEIAKRFMDRPPERDQLADLIVDEGQDLSLGFYRLAQWITANITVFADENQQLRDEHTTLDEIRRTIRAEEHLVLRRNYRNSVEIARLARFFYSGAPTGVPDLPERSWQPGPRLTRHESLNELVETIARHARTFANRRIGVAVPTSSLQVKLLNRLKHRDVPVQTYVSARPDLKTLDFGGPGVTVINYASVKGLQFDALFVPELQLVDQDVSSAAVRMRFYVITSRARNELYLSYTGSQEPPIVAGIPHDLLARA
ncbi:MAG: AAA family ATPase [Mycobacteriaceae bacterium]